MFTLRTARENLGSFPLSGCVVMFMLKPGIWVLR